MPTPTIWHILYQRNRFFTGREEVLTRLHRMLQLDARVALSHPLGISGLGGIGKTQTALEYAYRYRSEYEAIFWIRADSMSLTSSVAELARVLQLPECNERDQEIIVQAVLRWFHLHTGWLLIYDNVDDLSIAKPFLPTGDGHLLLTTRAHALGELAQRLDIQKMEPEIGALFLLRKANLLDLQDILTMASSDNQQSAQAISQELDGLPLALDQAGAYVKETSCTLSDYLKHYQTRRSDLLGVRGSFDQGYPASVATTWSLSFEKVRQTNPASAELLNFIAFLAPDAIPETIITQGAQYLPSILQGAVSNPLQFDLAIAVLLNYSLLRRNINATLDIHRLVQTILRDNMPVEERKQWMQWAVSVVNITFPYIEFAQWMTCERYLPHALVCATWVEQEQMNSLEAARLLHQAAYYLSERARYNEAMPLCVRALAIRERQLGETHPDTAQSLSNQAALYKNQGKYAEAEPMLVRALEIYKQQLGNTHPDTASSLNNLAALYSVQGRYGEAEPLCRQALEIYEQQLGETHPNTAQSLNNLAALYKNQGKYVEAESLLVRALEICRQQLGETHPNTAQSLNNLAALYDTQGKHGEAELLYRRALETYEQQLGETHPNVAVSLNNLAMLYQSRGKYAEAEPMYDCAHVA